MAFLHKEDGSVVLDRAGAEEVSLLLLEAAGSIRGLASVASVALSYNPRHARRTPDPRCGGSDAVSLRVTATLSVGVGW